MSRARVIFKWIVILLGALALFLLFSYLRPNQAHVDASVIAETWPIVNDGRHNSNTDLIEWNGDLYLIHASAPFHFAGADTYLSLKRSSDKGLLYLTDLPSAGDTSYAGLVRRGDELYVDYYTSDVTRDWFWLMGMVSPSEIRMARVNLPALERLAESKANGAR